MIWCFVVCIIKLTSSRVGAEGPTGGDVCASGACGGSGGTSGTG